MFTSDNYEIDPNPDINKIDTMSIIESLAKVYGQDSKLQIDRMATLKLHLRLPYTGHFHDFPTYSTPSQS